MHRAGAAVDAPAAVPDVRRGRVLRLVAQPPREQARGRARPSDRAVVRARRGLVLVLRRRRRHSRSTACRSPSPSTSKPPQCTSARSDFARPASPPLGFCRSAKGGDVTQSHMERLSPMDVSFLDQEKRGSHMHIGAVMLFEGPPPTHAELREHIESRLHLVPRYRQKLAYPRLEMGRPLWVDDPRFNLEYHVRHTALPSPGSDRAAAHADRPDLLAAPRPLEAAVGAVARAGARGRALRDHQQDPPRARRRRVRRGHHDGPVRHLTRLRRRSLAESWTPAVEPSDATLVAEGVKGIAGLPTRVARRALDAARRPRETAAERARGGGGARQHRMELREPGARDAAERADRPPSPGPVAEVSRSRSSRRSRTRSGGRSTTSSWRWCRGRSAAGCAAMACARRGWSCARIVPVSIRGDEQKGALGQPDHRDARAVAGLRAGPARALPHRVGVDERTEGVQAGRGGGDAHAAAGLRAADHPRAGIPAQLLDARVQRAGDQRAGAAVPALPDRPRAAGAGARAVPGARARARGRDDELQRQRRDRDDGRLRRDGGPRRVRRGRQGVRGRAAGRRRRGAAQGRVRLQRSPNKRSDRPC